MNHALTYRALAALLSYPSGPLLENLDELSGVLNDDRRLSAADCAALKALIDSLKRAELMDSEADYVDTFDRGRAASLNLFEHVHGDSRDRGQAMVDLLELYKAQGLTLSVADLPDFLPVFLEFLSLLDEQEAREQLQEVSHLIETIGATLTRRQSPYAAAFQALLRLAGERHPERLLAEREGGLEDSQRDAQLAGAGLKIGVNYLRKKYDIPEPAPDEETIGQAPAAPAIIPNGNPEPAPGENEDPENEADAENKTGNEMETKPEIEAEAPVSAKAADAAIGNDLAATLHETLLPLLTRLDAIAAVPDAAIQQHMLEKLLADVPHIANAISADDSLAKQLSPVLANALLAGLTAENAKSAKISNRAGKILNGGGNPDQPRVPAGSSEGGEYSEAPDRISAEEADQTLSAGVVEKNTDGEDRRFGQRAKDYIGKKKDATERKEHLPWAREAVRSGTKTIEKGNEVYAKVFKDKATHKAILTVASAKDGEVFDWYRKDVGVVQRRYLKNRQTDEQPSEPVLQALAAAGNLPDWFKLNPAAQIVNP